jgi:hypothetical protein
MTPLEWEEQYGQWIDPLRAPNGDLQVRLDRVAELVDERTAPRGIVGVLLGLLGLALAFTGGPFFVATGVRSQLERDHVVAQFLMEAAAAEKTIVEEVSPEPVGTYRTVVAASAPSELLPWYRRVFRRG